MQLYTTRIEPSILRTALEDFDAHVHHDPRLSSKGIFEVAPPSSKLKNRGPFREIYVCTLRNYCVSLCAEV